MKELQECLTQINNSISSTILTSPLTDCKNQLEKTSHDITKSLESISFSLEKQIKTESNQIDEEEMKE